MFFFILVCLFLLIAIALVRSALKNSGQSARGTESSNFSDDSAFYTTSASERYGASLDSATPDSSNTTMCSDTSADSNSDSGSCDSGDSGDSGGSSSSD